MLLEVVCEISARVSMARESGQATSARTAVSRILGFSSSRALVSASKAFSSAILPSAFKRDIRESICFVAFNSSMIGSVVLAF